jgi:nucleotide-binding universal stress UspA family protein
MGEPAARLPGDPSDSPALRRILFASDLSEESSNAFGHARLLAEAFGARLVLYHAVEQPAHEEPHWAFNQAMQVWRAAERVARQDLERSAASLSVPCQVQVERRACAHRALVDLIRASLPDLVVMATHGREGLAHLFLGSVTEKVVQHGHRPVLCVRRQEDAAAVRYRRILVPTDLSEASRRAFPLAALLARRFGSEIVAVHVLPDPAGAPGSAHPAFRPGLSEAALWQFFQLHFAGLPLTALVLTGSPWRWIVQTAELEDADLVVMSTLGHDSLGDRILGSNTERVVRHAPCPVLVA